MDTIRILVADDHAVVRAGLCTMLAGQPGIEVVAQAATSHDAVEQVGRYRPDVVLMDIRMPPTDGIEATRRISKALPDVRVIMLTVHDEDDYIVSAMQAGAAGYLLKDISREDLVAAISNVHQGLPALSPTVAQCIVRRVATPAHGAGEPLSEREREVLRRIARGESVVRIALALAVSEATVRRDVQLARRKLGASQQAEAVAKAYRRGLI